MKKREMERDADSVLDTGSTDFEKGEKGSRDSSNEEEDMQEDGVCFYI